MSDFISDTFVADGMCADVAIHDPYPPGHNPHAHIMLTVRPLDEKGNWQYKTQKEYLCVKNGEEQGFTADEFKIAQTEGWEKQYQYKVGRKKVYLPHSEAENHGYERASKHPKSTKFGRQKSILRKFAEDHHFPSPCFYVDDGFSGGTFQRPAFQQMISDMENGEIGIIVTKDLSRLGRNQLHTGLYIEERFPMFGVRYIAINDNVDTDSSESNDLMPFKNLFNEWFIRDTSRKIRAVLKAKAERGERLGTRAPYGYRKDPDTKKLIVDEEAAAIVRRIFAMCAGGSGPSQIARILKKEHILTPTMYAYSKYGITFHLS